jgi:hypothetical protein
LARRGAHVFQLRGFLVRAEERHVAVLELVVVDRQLEAVAERAHRAVVQLLGLVGRVERLARRAHAVALHGLGQDHGGLAHRLHRLVVVGGVDLVRIVAAAVEAPDVVVGHVGHHRGGLRVLAEEMLARVRAAEGLAVLVLAVDGFHHQLLEHALGVLGQQRIPVAAPDQP